MQIFLIDLFIVNRRRDFDWAFQNKVTLRLAIQNLHRLQAINIFIIHSEILEVNWNHVKHISHMCFQNHVSILLVKALLVIPIFEHGLNSFSGKAVNRTIVVEITKVLIRLSDCLDDRESIEVLRLVESFHSSSNTSLNMNYTRMYFCSSVIVLVKRLSNIRSNGELITGAFFDFNFDAVFLSAFAPDGSFDLIVTFVFVGI